MSSGLRTINNRAGSIPIINVYTPKLAQAVLQPQFPMRNWADNGIRARPVPCPMLSIFKASGLRLINQLLIASDVPNSRGLANTVRAGT